jgi:hypothetical protein
MIGKNEEKTDPLIITTLPVKELKKRLETKGYKDFILAQL